ncbi:MAG: hypothetical protein PUF17_07335 [Lactimicrobium massiliense]|nr:hypothetical protein [Lactimicrobium massiliense]MDD6560768.1 hypothetical protein [Lactimicrobium massiliense]
MKNFKIYQYDNKKITYDRDNRSFTIREPAGVSVCNWNSAEIPEPGTWFIARQNTVLGVNGKSAQDCEVAVREAGKKDLDLLHVSCLHEKHTAADIERDFGISADISAVPDFRKSKLTTGLYAGLLDIARIMDIHPRDVAINKDHPLQIAVEDCKDGSYDATANMIHLPQDCHGLGYLWSNALFGSAPYAFNYLIFRAEKSGIHNQMIVGQDHNQSSLTLNEREKAENVFETLREERGFSHYPHPVEIPVYSPEKENEAEAAVTAVIQIVEKGGLSALSKEKMRGENDPQTQEKEGDSDDEVRVRPKVR